MMRFAVWIIAVLGVSATQAAPVPPETRHVAFVGVNLIPMTGDRVIENATVIVSDGRVAAIGPEASVTKPRDARVIDGRGKYLMPGLAEMHAHVPGAQASQAYREDVLFLYVANGVTLARGMLGEPLHLGLRSDLAAHRVLGPRLITSGPSINGNSAATVGEAIRMVREQRAAGYDFVKLHPGLKRDVFLAMADAAREVGIPFAGHVSADVGLDLSLDQGQATIDHLDGYLVRLLPEAIRAKEAPDDLRIVDRVDRSLMPELVRITRAAGAWVVPTQTLYEHMTGPTPTAELDARPEMRYVPARLREQYRKRKEAILSADGYDAQLAEHRLAVRRSIIRALHDGGAGVLLGSDAPQIYNVPGFSIHRELEELVRSGLTPYEALRSGTAAPAEFFGDEGRYGVVVVGADADLVLLDANPLKDVSNTRKIAGVMVRGRWLDRAYIDRELEAVAARAAQ